MLHAYSVHSTWPCCDSFRCQDSLVAAYCSWKTIRWHSYSCGIDWESGRFFAPCQILLSPRPTATGHVSPGGDLRASSMRRVPRDTFRWPVQRVREASTAQPPARRRTRAASQVANGKSHEPSLELDRLGVEAMHKESRSMALFSTAGPLFAFDQLASFVGSSFGTGATQ